MHQSSPLNPPYSSRFNVIVTTDAIFMVSSYPVPLPTANQSRTTGRSTQTELPQLPSHASIGTQTLKPPGQTNIAVQACPLSKPTVTVAVQATEVQEDASPFPTQDQDLLYQVNPVPSDDVWRSSPEQYGYGSDPQSLLDPPLPPIPPLPRPPREYVTYHIDEEWGHRINVQKPPAPPPPRASYLLAETTADVLSFVSKHYPSILHAQFDYYRLPPFQRRAILDLHRLLFPYGLSKWRSAAPFGLLPMRFIMSYFYTWEEVMGRLVQDSGAEVDYQLMGGVFYR
ncbi:hypothetical protein FS837_005379 [Tulasnella sp. UAMH 9824]|nr:hypothetical protein FS837_005379 [Tulasnella sp. UAMH 9824]